MSYCIISHNSYALENRLVDWCAPYLLSKGANTNLHADGCSAVEYVLRDPMNYPVDALPLLLSNGAVLPPHAFQSLLKWPVPDFLPFVPREYTGDI